MKKKHVAWLLILLLLAAFTAWVIWDNNRITVTEYTFSDPKIPESFSGYRIVQVSDLHNAEFGENNNALLEKLRGLQPDIIVLTGDLVDSYRTDIGVALTFAEQAAKIAPTYYVTGNHEARIAEYEALKAGLTQAGVVLLENETLFLEKGSEVITLMGVDDPSFQTAYLVGDSQGAMENILGTLAEESDGYTILLSHRPELFETYVTYGVDLVFSGHAHGGQFRLPFIGGLYAPGQGLFPEYDAGLYTEGSTNMIVSRGLGNSLFPFRIANPPEIVVAQLEHE